MDAPPRKSRIRVKREQGADKITLVPAKSTVLTSGSALALLIFVFICMRAWIFHEEGVAILLGGPFEPLSNPSHFFIVFLGVLLLLLALVQTWESSPEIFFLQDSGMTYSTKKEKVVFTLEQLHTLRLRKRPGGYRLFIYHGNEQLELGPDISKLEREWLYKQIMEKYSLRQNTIPKM